MNNIFLTSDNFDSQIKLKLQSMPQIKIGVFLHSHTKRNSLDTRVVFIEFSEYDNDGEGDVYWRDRYFKMSSKSFTLAMALKEFWHF